MEYRYIVKGEPQVLQRHRFAKGRTYNLSKPKQIAFAKQYELPDEPITEPLEVDMTFYCSRPKSHKRMKNPPAYPRRGDLDNMIKFVLDALNGKLYEDDSQIVKITATKCYCAECEGGEDRYSDSTVLRKPMYFMTNLVTSKVPSQ
jgi:Holliday junction resolvase RusA-like endonuclease